MKKGLIIAILVLLAISPSGAKDAKKSSTKSGGKRVVVKKAPIQRARIAKTYYLTVTATAFCPCPKCCERYSSWYKAVHVHPRYGIAVDPRVIPLGSRCSYLGRTYLAFSTGGAIKGRRIDVWFPPLQGEKDFTKAHARAKAFGRKVWRIRVER